MPISVNGTIIAGVGKNGRPGKDGKSAYDAAKSGGYQGTEEEFNSRLARIITAEETPPSPINADTLGGKPASDYVTKNELASRLDEIIACDIQIYNTSVSPIKSKLYLSLKDNLLYAMYDQTYTFAATGEPTGESNQISITLPSSGLGNDLVWKLVGSSSDSIFIYETIDSGSTGSISRIVRLNFSDNVSLNHKELNLYTRGYRGSTLAITIPRGFYFGVQKI